MDTSIKSDLISNTPSPIKMTILERTDRYQKGYLDLEKKFIKLNTADRSKNSQITKSSKMCSWHPTFGNHLHGCQSKHRPSHLTDWFMNHKPF